MHLVFKKKRRRRILDYRERAPFRGNSSKTKVQLKIRILLKIKIIVLLIQIQLNNFTALQLWRLEAVYSLKNKRRVTAARRRQTAKVEKVESQGRTQGGGQCGRRPHLTVSSVGYAMLWKNSQQMFLVYSSLCRFSKGIW